jgi:hypothetical protein
MLRKLRLALAVTILGLAAVSAVDSASARPDRLKDVRTITGLNGYLP